MWSCTCKAIAMHCIFLISVSLHVDSGLRIAVGSDEPVAGGRVRIDASIVQ